jgi:hypothetical protein
MDRDERQLMEVFFADDSTQKGAREAMGTVVSVGGVLVDERALRPLAAALDQIAAEYKFPPGEEFKWSPRKGSWIYSNLHAEVRQECYSRALQAAADHGAQAIVICWDTGRTTLREQDAFNRCVGFLFERLTVHLTKRETSAIVVADRPGGGRDQETTFLHNFLEHVQSGTEYVVPDRVLMNVLTTSSHLVRQLQLADLVTGISTAMVCGRFEHAALLFPAVNRILIRNNMGTCAGTGLKLFPATLVNLYHWILKEHILYRHGGATGYRLPQAGYFYARDEMKAA